jgi:hypothetical protein
VLLHEQHPRRIAATAAQFITLLFMPLSSAGQRTKLQLYGEGLRLSLALTFVVRPSGRITAARPSTLMRTEARTTSITPRRQEREKDGIFLTKGRTHQGAVTLTTSTFNRLDGIGPVAAGIVGRMSGHSFDRTEAIRGPSPTVHPESHIDLRPDLWAQPAPPLELVSCALFWL